MESLRGLASLAGTTELTLPSGRPLSIASWTVHFPPSTPDRLAPGLLPRSYTTKPLVEVDGENMFGELAVATWLAKDQWLALWVDTFHGRKFWRAMPHRSEPVIPPPNVQNLYDRIADRNGSPAGCFDVVAWRGDRIVWLEYKGQKDKPNPNELCWLDAAIGAGVVESDLIFVGEKARPSRYP